MIVSLWVIFFSWVLLVLYFLVEYRFIKNSRKKIPIRIGVTGTRGKTSLVRTIAGALSANGLRVIAKTTGTDAVIIYPDGAESEISRIGMTSIAEQKTLIRLAAKSGVDILVSEIMSISRENQRVESKDILGITHCFITNARIDHPEQGNTKRSVLECLMESITPECIVFCVEDEINPILKEKVEDNNGRLITVFSEKGINTDLTLALCEELGLDKNLSYAGIGSSKMDRGWTSITRLGPYDCINLFAVNDIESTTIMLEKLEPKKRIGIINLRSDRQERTIQYIEACRNGVFDSFEMLFITGRQARLFCKKVNKIIISKQMDEEEPEVIMEIIKNEIGKRECQIIGMGNIIGVDALIEYWKEVGEPVEFN